MEDLDLSSCQLPCCVSDENSLTGLAGEGHARLCHGGDCKPLSPYRSLRPSALTSGGHEAFTQSRNRLGRTGIRHQGQEWRCTTRRGLGHQGPSSAVHHHLKHWLTWRDSSLREDRMSFAPCWANSRASSSPRPWEAPVSQTTCRQGQL